LADKGYKLWVTSSSETLLGKEVLSYLVGRVSILRLYPFSLPEFQKARKTESLTEKIKERLVWEHVNYGGYPKAVLADDFESKKMILKDLADTMLLKDVSRTFAIEDISLLERLVRYLSVNTGNIISYENITTYFGVSFQTLKKCLDAMEKSYITTRIHPYHTNKLKELSKKPKIYFIDTGLRNNILKSYPTEVEGKVFENYVLTELLKHGLQVRYWRTKNKAEVDFVIEKERTTIPVEVKIKADKAGRGIKSFIKAYKPEKAFLVRYSGTEKEEDFEGCKITFTDVFGLLKKIT
jgi:predicted AAA+ superfamily ATPase